MAQPGYQNTPGYPPAQGGAYPPTAWPPGGGYAPPPGSNGYPPASGGYPPPQPGMPQPGMPQPGMPQAGMGMGDVGMTTKQVEPWAPAPGTRYQGSDIGMAGAQPGAEPTAPAMPPPPVYTGYEHVNYDTEYLPPPPTYDSLPPPETPEMAMGEFNGASTISEEVVRESLLNLANANCCWGDAPAKDMRVNSIDPVPALHYTMESFCEQRHTKAKTEPYVGGPVDGPFNGQPPPPWSIPVTHSGLFVACELKIEVPHTASVVGCNKCFARGFVRCWHCHGRGEDRCISCHGSGQSSHTEFVDGESRQVSRQCFSCNGRGEKRCMSCHGSGMTRCSRCEGYRMLKSFIQMKVKFENVKDDYVYERTALPVDLIKNVSGQKVFEQDVPRVGPILGYKIKEINEKSAEFVQKHANTITDKRIVHQRQILRAVPVTEVKGTFKDTDYVFWVFGEERHCHFPDYPNRCCCNCVIL